MQKYLSSILIICTLLFSLTNCELIGDIFKAGVWSGILICFLVVAFIVFLIVKSKKE